MMIDLTWKISHEEFMVLYFSIWLNKKLCINHLEITFSSYNPISYVFVLRAIK
jgi:hypothetical protein